MPMSSDWRNHTNAMTTAERAAAWLQACDPKSTQDALTEFGHVCANAELERHRETQRERDYWRKTADDLEAEKRNWETGRATRECIEKQRAQIATLGEELDQARAALASAKNALDAHIARAAIVAFEGKS
jgi:multidrug resistance efflux pump